jgi:hypothetical protein
MYDVSIVLILALIPGVSQLPLNDSSKRLMTLVLQVGRSPSRKAVTARCSELGYLGKVGKDKSRVARFIRRTPWSNLILKTRILF